MVRPDAENLAACCVYPGMYLVIATERHSRGLRQKCDRRDVQGNQSSFRLPLPQAVNCDTITHGRKKCKWRKDLELALQLKWYMEPAVQTLYLYS